jgi:hypothetical protein
MSENLAAPDDEKFARELAQELDEELAQELAKNLELDEKLAQELDRKLKLEDSLSEAEDADPGQLTIMQAIREEAERKKIEKALQDYGSDSDFWQHQKLLERRLLLTWIICSHSNIESHMRKRIFWRLQELLGRRLLLMWTTCSHSYRQRENGNMYQDLPYEDIVP